MKNLLKFLFAGLLEAERKETMEAVVIVDPNVLNLAENLGQSAVKKIQKAEDLIATKQLEITRETRNLNAAKKVTGISRKA